MLLQDRQGAGGIQGEKECEEDKVRIKMGKSSWESTEGVCEELHVGRSPRCPLTFQ